MKKAEKEKLRNEIIDEGIKQGLSANEILKQLKKEENYDDKRGKVAWNLKIGEGR